ncbi:hypothetical protein NIES4103_66060 [Nostoc sp. NIES-4103]|nr:hypothetical protein NIES4103_66060 [Nostoc sp. NIES-4103]
MIKKKSIYLSPGCSLNSLNKVININFSSEGILNLVTHTIKSCYSPETLQETFETNLDEMGDLSPSKILKLKENIAIPKPDTLVVVGCQFGEFRS